jgi:hypothetical protein
MDESVVKHLEQPAELDEVSLVLLKAARLIEAKGWYQHPGPENGSYCAALAIEAVGGEHGFAARKRFGAVIGVVHGGCIEIGAWNDAPERTVEEVVSTMRRVALGG